MGDVFEMECEVLVVKFEDKKDYSFKIFKDLWAESNLRKLMDVDLKKPSEDIAESIPYIFYNFEATFYCPVEMYKKAGILYLMYMLYNVRKDYQHFKIMVKYGDFECIKEFLTYCRNELLLDPLYIFYKLRMDDAFKYYYGVYRRLPNKKVKQMANWKTAKDIHTKSTERIAEIDKQYKELLKKFIPDY